MDFGHSDSVKRSQFIILRWRFFRFFMALRFVLLPEAKPLDKMSGRSTSSSESSFDIGELLQIQARCRERLEQHVKTLSEAQTEDKKQIQEMERELSNCSQEIDYLQDQLKARNMEVDSLNEHVHSLMLKLADMEDLEEEIGKLREELKWSHSERLFLMQELENKEMEIQASTLCIEKIEESITSIVLEHECEIESMKLDMMALEQSCFEAKKFQGESTQDKARMNELIQDFQLPTQDSQRVIKCLDEENKELREKIDTFERNARIFCQKIEEKFQELQEEDTQLSLSASEEDKSIFGDILGPILSQLVVVGASDAALKDKMEKMSQQIVEYELLVKQLKEELREEKLKAKEEAEDLAQEMAELRYQFSGLLEEECKRRASIEQISLQRIAELESQIEKEQMKSITSFRHMHEA